MRLETSSLILVIDRFTIWRSRSVSRASDNDHNFIRANREVLRCLQKNDTGLPILGESGSDWLDAQWEFFGKLSAEDFDK